MIIGWDGADWEILHDLIARGCLPRLEAMLQEGASGDLISTIPSHSWAAWSSFLTGLNPGGHGVFDFVERHPTQPNKRVPISSKSIAGKTFLETLSAAGHELRAANIPVTFPPLGISGRMIAGVAIPPGAQFVHPREWGEELQRRAPFPLNGMEWTRAENDPLALIDEAREFVAARTKSFEVLLEDDWRAAVIVYVATDRLQHALGAYLLPSHPDHKELAESPIAEAARGVYTLLDEATHRLIELSGEDTTVLLISDHGFRPVNRACNLNSVLQSLGFLSTARAAGMMTAVRRSSTVSRVTRSRLGRLIKKHVNAPETLDWASTVAFQSATGAGISVNLRGREPHGVVTADDYERVRDEVSAALLAFEDPVTGDQPVGQVFKREELYTGPCLDLAPDLFLEPSPMWALGHTQSISTGLHWPTGAHRQEGIVVAAGAQIKEGDLGRRPIIDIPATALAFFGISSDALDGEPITEVSGRKHEKGVAAPVRLPGSTPQLNEEEEAFITSHLRDLGYIE